MNNTQHNVHPPTADEVAGRAYALWLRDRCAHGRDMEHRLQAEYKMRRERKIELSAKRPPRQRAKGMKPPAA